MSPPDRLTDDELTALDCQRCPPDYRCLTRRAVAEIRRNRHEQRQMAEQLASIRRRHANLLEQRRAELGRQHRDEVRLDAAHHVWCSGPCQSGVHRYDETGRFRAWDEPHPPLTREIVEAAIANTIRMVTKLRDTEVWADFRRQVAGNPDGA